MNIVYKINLWPFTVDKDFALGNSLFGAATLTNKVDFDKYKYCGYGIWFDARRRFLLSNSSGFCKNAVMFGADISSSAHIDNKKNFNC